MNKKKVFDLLTAMSFFGTSEYAGYYPTDERVIECLMDMYFYMLYKDMDNEEKKEEYFQEFENKYDKLNGEQQEEVKNEYINIIEAQKKNREKEKIKKKGMNNYE